MAVELYLRRLGKMTSFYVASCGCGSKSLKKKSRKSWNKLTELPILGGLLSKTELKMATEHRFSRT